jgi:hypothetical protein
MENNKRSNAVIDAMISCKQESKRQSLKRKFGSSVYDFASKAEALRALADEISDNCIRRDNECDAYEAELSSKYDAVIEEAKQEAASMRAAAKSEIASDKAALAQERATWEAEKKKIAHTQGFKSQVMLDIGGNRFTTSLTTLQRFPDTMIGAMFSGRHALPTAGEYFFIDRDGTHFRHILNFLRQPEGFKVDLPEGQLDELKRECEYFGVRDKMFPWKSIPRIVQKTVTGVAVGITQRQDHLWCGSRNLLTICRSCQSASFINGRVTNYIDKFTTVPYVRELPDAQPRSESCGLCTVYEL